MQLKSLMRGLCTIVLGLIPSVGFAQHATGSYTQVVTKAAGTVTIVTSNNNPSTFTQSVTLSLAVPAGATGTVQFLDGGVALGAPATISGASASYTTTTLAVGTHPVTATYSGDSNFATSTTTGTLSQVVNKGTGTLTVASGTNPSIYASNVTFTATLASGATGTVTFYDNGVSIGTGTATNGTATFTTSTLTVGTHPITVQYAGDGSFAAITASNTVNQVVNKASAVSDVLTVNPNPATYGAAITFTNTLPTNATGTISFYDGTTLLGTGTLTNGVAQFVSSTPLAAGTHTITAVFPGDSNYPTQTSNAVTLIVTKQTAESITLTSNLNPAAAGASVTFSAALPKDATGTVDFFDGATKIGTGAVTAGTTNATATFTTSTLAVGTHPITATYNGDSNYSNVTSTALTETITQGTATLTISGVPNPSVYGGNVVMTITVTGVNNVAPTGTITLVDGANPLGSTLTLTPGTGGVSTATYNTSTLTAGSHPITATYSGDTNYK